MTVRFVHPSPALLVAGATLGLVLAGCGPSGEQPSPPASEPAPIPTAPGRAPTVPTPTTPAPTQAQPEPLAGARKEAQAIFSTRCFTCHGKEGRGNGPASEGLQPLPRNFHDSDWQASVTDEHIRRIIVLGGPAVGKSPLMPPNPDLATKPDVVAALAEHVRSFRTQ